MLRLCLLLSILAALPAAACESRSTDGIPAIRTDGLPAEARETLFLIRHGGPFPHRKDGSTFSNFERRLPLRPRGYYREYTVPAPGARDRGPRRIIAGSGAASDVRISGEYYYTGDHYRSFRKICE